MGLFGANKVCTRCGTVGRPVADGSLIIEVLLYFMMIIPGLIYSVWRLTTKRVCRACHGPVVPLGSPLGSRMADANNPARLQ